jgi:hypothetical protein
MQFPFRPDRPEASIYGGYTAAGALCLGQSVFHPKRQTKLPTVNFVAFWVPANPDDPAPRRLCFPAIEAPFVAVSPTEREPHDDHLRRDHPS